MSQCQPLADVANAPEADIDPLPGSRHSGAIAAPAGTDASVNFSRANDYG